MTCTIHTADLEAALLPLAKYSGFLTAHGQSNISIMLFVQKMTDAHGGHVFREVWDKVVLDIETTRANGAARAAKMQELRRQFPPGTTLIDEPNPDLYATGK